MIKKTQNQFFGTKEDLPGKMPPGTCYFDIENSNLYTYNHSGLPVLSSSGGSGSEGPIGPQGEQGVQGEQGIQGETGPQGEQGPQGIQGETGADGSSAGSALVANNGSDYDAAQFRTNIDVYSKAESDALQIEETTGVGKNLFNKELATDGAYMSNNGFVVSNANYSYSDFIAVTEGETYVATHSMRFTTHYDENKTIVSGSGSDSAITSFVIPTGVYFVVVTANTTDKDVFQLEENTVSTGYEPYTYPAELLYGALENKGALVYDGVGNISTGYDQVDMQHKFLNFVSSDFDFSEENIINSNTGRKTQTIVNTNVTVVGTLPINLVSNDEIGRGKSISLNKHVSTGSFSVIGDGTTITFLFDDLSTNTTGFLTTGPILLTNIGDNIWEVIGAYTKQ